MQTYIIVMDGIAALELLALTAGLGGTAWRAPSKPFRAVTVGGAALSSVYHVLPTSLFEHPAAELSVDDSAQLGEDRRQPDHIA